MESSMFFFYTGHHTEKPSNSKGQSLNEAVQIPLTWSGSILSLVLWNYLDIPAGRIFEACVHKHILQWNTMPLHAKVPARACFAER